MAGGWSPRLTVERWFVCLVKMFLTVDGDCSSFPTRIILRSFRPPVAMNTRRDVRGNSSALFDDIEGGGIRATSSYSSHEIDEHENDRAMDGLQDRVFMLKRVISMKKWRVITVCWIEWETIWIHQEVCSLELWIDSRRFLRLNQAEGCLRSWLPLLWVS
ncbi:hypothetical protein L1987_86055 [Smallanthus sonchifolius]|uniref:Uncharacterized protein n=1 Tax=Smallanthus sonchifolius TaxID=185202 RepID=A0ACB8XZ99_9ASTR|nr:hypothetical protein L1987_86055 [Smallanthus sonchifolius]